MMTCKHVTRLLSEARDRPLILSERMGLGIHLFMCSGCRHCGDQMDLLRAACRHAGGGEGEKTHLTL
ncbi:MAG: zf-HC2 domain-containing protein [Magnetococcales bacterium]|nr:zf-HC2 domain-containing protein [Magnetococcales bacterium]